MNAVAVRAVDTSAGDAGRQDPCRLLDQQHWLDGRLGRLQQQQHREPAKIAMKACGRYLAEPARYRRGTASPDDRRPITN